MSNTVGQSDNNIQLVIIANNSSQTSDPLRLEYATYTELHKTVCTEAERAPKTTATERTYKHVSGLEHVQLKICPSD